ncbi:AfsR/SARP family transcriptional regulator [Umezawaea sp.]|uniref:AfsR/SARP family transcriptional regulator n=1 Tax=Umezawaea sp. TaxID=1955258 RepID=UPI002ED4F1E2
MDVEFRVLDGVEARVGGRRLPLGHARQRCVLVALLVDVNRAVTVDRLLERVWDEKPPLRARSVLRTYVSRLRKALADTGATITRRDGGYSLNVAPDTVDLCLAWTVHRAEGPEAALDHYQEAVDLALRTDYRVEEARAHEGMAEALRELGRVEESRSHAGRARAIRTWQCDKTTRHQPG